MSPEEAIWIGKELASIGVEALSPLVNLGSSTQTYRTEACPQIEQYIFGPLRERGVVVRHVDIKPDPGVDIVGSVFDKRVQERIASLSPGSILCNNLLEHAWERSRLAGICEALLRPAGFLVVTVPFQYPYHPDPIDTGFRADLETLQGLFSNLTLVRGETIHFGNYWGQLRQKKWLILRDAYLLLRSPFSRDKRRVLSGNYRYLRRPYLETCAIFRRDRG